MLNLSLACCTHVTQPIKIPPKYYGKGKKASKPAYIIKQIELHKFHINIASPAVAWAIEFATKRANRHVSELMPYFFSLKHSVSVVHISALLM